MRSLREAKPNMNWITNRVAEAGFEFYTPPPITRANYGFIPRTYADDLDPLDVLVLCSETNYPMTLVRCYPIGVITMIDNGRNDEKIIAIPLVTNLQQLYRHFAAAPAYFLTR